MANKQDTLLEVQAHIASGSMIQGRYIVESLLGKGEFGTIYLVRDQHNKESLFVLAEVFNPKEEESYHFTLEYIAPKSLDDQALPRVQYVFHDDKLNRAYVLMSYIEEPTLEMLRLQQPDKRFPLPKVMTLMVPVLNALNYLHHQNPPVIHGNINPTNIIVSRALHTPVLTMLALVKESNSASTILDYFSPGYGAPEQYRKEIGTRTDIYALGATCYTLLAGIIPPDALYRSTQLNNGEIDPLKPLDEVIPSISPCIAEAIQQSMSLNLDDRYSSVQQFEQVLIGSRRFQESPTLRLQPGSPKQDLSPKADSVEQKPSEPMTAPTSATQTNVAKQQSPEPFLVPSVVTVQQEPVSEVPPLLAVTEELPTPEEVPTTLAHEELAASEATSEIEPPASVAQKPPVPEEAALIEGDCEPSTSEIVPSPAVAEEPPVLEVMSSASNQSSIIPDKAVEAPAESLPSQSRTVLTSNSDTVRAAPSRQIVEKTSFVSMFKRVRARKVGVLLIVIAFVMSFGIAAVLWSDISGYPVSHSRAPVQNVKGSKLISASPSVSSMYPMLTGTYSGTIYDLSRDISTSMKLTGMRQSEGNISGYLELGPNLQDSGHFSGKIGTSKELQFIVTDAKGNASLFFEGVMQSETSLTGDYYRCSPVDPVQGGRCKQAPGSYGIWEIALLSK